MKITLKQLQKRIDELERQVRELQARPVYVPVFPANPQPIQYHPDTVSTPNITPIIYIGDAPQNPMNNICGGNTVTYPPDTFSKIQVFNTDKTFN